MTKNVSCWGGLLATVFFIAIAGCDKLERKPSYQAVVPPAKPESNVVQVKGLAEGKEIKKVSLGFNHSCVLYTDGTVACWGGNEFGQLGYASLGEPKPEDAAQKAVEIKVIRNQTPQEIKGAPLFEDIVAGELVTCGIEKAADKNLYCWGKNTYKQIGLNAADKGNAIATPTQIMRTSKKAIKKEDGSDDVETTTVPLTGVLKVYSNFSTVCALTAKEALCWGNTLYAHVDEDKDGKKVRKVDVMSKQPEPTAINPVQEDIDGFGPEWMDTTTPASLVILQNDICASVDKALRCLKSKSAPAATNIQRLDGRNENYLYFSKEELAEIWYVMANGTDPVKQPIRLEQQPENILDYSVGKYHECLMVETEGKRDAKDVFCMGANSFGQLGFTPGPSEYGPTPVRQEGFKGAKMIASGDMHNCAVTPDDQVWCWGANDQGQCGAEPKKAKSTRGTL